MPLRPDTWTGLLISVAGGRRAGASLLAACLAEDLAGDASNRGLVLLAGVAADGADTALSQVRPDGVATAPDSTHWAARAQLRLDGVAAAPDSADWAARAQLRPDGAARARDCPDGVARAQVRGGDDLEGLLGAYRFVVADIESDVADVVGSAPPGGGGATAAAVLRRSDLVLVVGTGDSGRLQSLVQSIESLAGLVGADRVLPVVNRLPRGFRRRSAAVSEAVRLLAGSAAFAAGDPVLITEHDTVRRAARQGLAPPPSLVRPLASEVRSRLAAAMRTGGGAAPRPTPAAGD